MIMIKGQTNSITIEVKKQHLANVVGSGELEVLATPAMIAFMEKAASQLVSDQLEEGQTSVGTLMNVEHTSASPLGMKVTVTATVTGVDGRKIDFEVIISTTDANPNGDPLSGNRPRINSKGLGEISDVCIKRKIRNRLQDMGERIFVQSDDKCDDGCDSLRARVDSCDELKKISAGKNTNKDEYARIAC